MKHRFIAIIWLCIITNSLTLGAEDIQVADFGGRITVIGKLGKPVGTIVTNIEGQLISDPKQSKSGKLTAALRLTKVEGTALAKAQTVGVEFRASEGMPHIHARDFIRFSGYEGGAFIGTPDAARESLGSDASPLDWKFETIVYVVKFL